MEENNLDELKKKLYRKNLSFKDRLDRDQAGSPHSKNEPVLYWGKKQSNKTNKIIPANELRIKTKSFFQQFKIFIYLLIFFTFLAGSAAAYLIYTGDTIVSSANVELSASGPVFVNGGQSARFNFIVSNQNSAKLEDADLTFDFPSNTFSEKGVPLTRTRLPLGALESGAIVNKTIDLVFFGLEGEEKKIVANLEYRFADSNAIFAKNENYAIKISKAPLGISLTAPTEVVSGQNMTLKTIVVSNAEAVAKNLRLEMNYPTGFKFIGAKPNPSRGNNVWNLGELGSSQKKVIEINGIIEGENDQDRNFTVSIGALDEDGNLKPFGEASAKTAIKKSPLNLAVLVNGQNNQESILYPGDQVRVDLEWTNNLSSGIRDATIELSVTGNAIEEKSISIVDGHYRSQDKKIVWNAANSEKLLLIPAGKSDKAQIGFNIKNILPILRKEDKHFSINIDAKILGTGTSEEFENKEISDTAKGTIKVSSGLQSAGRILYHSGNFKNTGPIPPKIGAKTTYTAIWSLANNINDLSSVKVTASLPPYVNKGELVSPEDSGLRFDTKNATLIWEIGELPAGAGIIAPAKEVSLQVYFTPNLTQIGERPVLINKATVEATDAFTGEKIITDIPALTVSLQNDPQSNGDDDRVRE